MSISTIKKLVEHQSLSYSEARQLLRDFVGESMSDVQKAALLIALAAKGETVEEITGMARAMRELSVKVPVKNPLLDTCGTGGSGLTRLNVSTASAFILASCGVRVAKHGNRAASGRVGSFDVLEVLGAKIELSPDEVARTIKETNLGFIFAPLYHPAIKNIMPVRKELGIRTVFNILGPLTNPANAKYQVLGVSDPKLGATMIAALQKLGCKRALVVHGEDGLDEITMTAPTRVWELTQRGTVKTYRIKPQDFGIKQVPFSKIKGGDAAYNARAILGILDGTITDGRRNLVLLNAAAGLYVYGKVKSLGGGVARAKNSVITHETQKLLNRYLALTRAM